MSDIKVYKTTNLDAVNRVLNTPELRAARNEEELDYPMIPGMDYLAIDVDGELRGMYALHPLSETVYQGHINILPKYWGDNDSLTLAAIEWVFNEYGMLKIIGLIPANCSEILAHVERVGFLQEGCLKDSIKVNGELKDQVLVSISNQEKG